MIKTLKPCLHCGKPAKEGFKPFCTKRCTDIDLGAWLSNTYSLPGSLEGRESEVDELIEGIEQEEEKTQ